MSLSGDAWIVLTGILVSVSCALLGTFLVLRKMSLLGDALSHAVLPGLAFAFFFADSLAVIPMFIGAAAFGVITTMLVEVFHQHWSVPEDASIGIAFTSLFALGVILITLFADQVHLDQECVLYGEIAFTPWDTLTYGGRDLGPRPVWILSGVLILNLLLVVLFYKELVIASFDAALATSMGISATLVHYLLMGAVSLTTVASFESVGAILVVALLIVPGASAYLWSSRLPVILALAVAFAVFAAVTGYWLSGLWDSSIAGAMVSALGGVFAVSLLIAPDQGLVSRLWQRLSLSVRVARDHMLLEMVRRAESGAERSWPRRELMRAAAVWPGLARLGLLSLRHHRLARAGNGSLALTERGERMGLRLLRSHRLWESYLSGLGLPTDHVHDPADALEHFIDEDMERELDAEVEGAVDPQGKEIPR